jgi:hypothetical protein
MVGRRTPLVIQLLHNLPNDLPNRLYCFNILFRFRIVFLKILQREPDYNRNAVNDNLA